MFIKYLILELMKDVLEMLVLVVQETDWYVGCQGYVFHNTNLLTLRCLRWANQTVMSAMKETGFGSFRAWLDWSNNSSQMGQSSKITCVSFEHLGNSSFSWLTSFVLSPVTCGQGVPDSLGQSNWVKTISKLTVLRRFSLLLNLSC